MRCLYLLPLALLLGCPGEPAKDSGDSEKNPLPTDADGDGTPDESDCAPEDPSVHPGVSEVCDGVDQDCNGVVDDDLTGLWYPDADADTYGDSSLPVEGCKPDGSYVEQGGDCNDADPAFHPGASEFDCEDPNDYNCDGSVAYTDADADGFPACRDCDDATGAVYPGATERCNGVDDNCDGSSDGPDAVDATLWYVDADGDGYGVESSAVAACEAPANTAARSGDCNDADFLYNPGTAEVDCTDPNDYNCDGSVGYTDADGDGFAACADCNDSAAAVSPDGVESCNGLDDNCDGTVDEDSAADAVLWYQDADGDIFGDATISRPACTAPAGFVADATDCSDGDGTVYPGAPERCNGIDDSCDGTVDELGAVDAPLWYQDNDGDGYGDSALTGNCQAPSGYVGQGGDCNDAESAISPAASELCDGLDQNCNGAVDDYALDASLWFADTDGDGYGDAATVTSSCEAPAGAVQDDTDCDDQNFDTNPGAVESCNGADDNCDGTIDEPTAADTFTQYLDADGDGYGTPATSTETCTLSPGYSASSTDCDDSRSAVNPGATESCNQRDDNCDGSVDEDSAVDASTWYLDADGDQHGSAATSRRACTQPAGYSTLSDDCNDADVGIYPGASEYCDGDDNDCDGQVDEAGAVDASAWYRDADGDGYGAGSSLRSCSAPSGYVSQGTDCSDSASNIHPGSDEYCNAVDEDCDGTADNNPVDGQTWYADADADGYGDPGTALAACSQPAGTLGDASDCDDAVASAYPGSTATEVPFDGVDTDCDGNDFCTDLNCDGRPDLAEAQLTTGSTYATNVYLYTNNGTGYFSTGLTVLPSYGPYDLAVADLNEDGYQDVVVPNYTTDSGVATASYVYWGAATGYTTANRSSLAVTGAARAELADFNNDGWTDILFASYYSGSSYSSTSYIYYGSSTGYSTANRTALSTVGVWEAKVADLNHDGYLDIIFASYYSGTSYSSNSRVWWGAAAGFTAANGTNLPTYGAYDVEVADFNADGYEDIAFANYFDGSNYTTSSYLYYGSATGYSTANRTSLTTYGALSVESGDIDGDGLVDLIFGGYYAGSWASSAPTRVYYNSSNGFSNVIYDEVGTKGTYFIQVEDLDSDAYDDIVTPIHYDGSNYGTTSYVYWGSSAGVSNANRVGMSSNGSLNAAIGDINGDGWPELTFNGYYSGSWSSNAYGTLHDGASGYTTALSTQIVSRGVWAAPVLVGNTDW
jgi:Putative metal-binding motif/FG-GAP-like repeat